jgi:glycine/D-amino acid oxidase-like deaminating enzyme
MIPRLAFLFCAMLAVAACSEETTLLAGLNTRAQVDAFVSSARSIIAEPVTSPVTEGAGAMRVRFFGHPSLASSPQVAATGARGGLRYTDWSVYERLLLDVYNAEAEAVQVTVFVRSANKEYTQVADLPAGQWTTVPVSVADLRAAGLNVSAIDALGLRMDIAGRKRPTRLVVDNLRLCGTDVAAIRRARAQADAAASRRPAPLRTRTEAVNVVMQPLPNAGFIERTVRVPVVAKCEVLVVGGGLAGVAAAVTAARMGCDTLLVERSGSLGGMATIGLVPPAFRPDLSEGIVAEFLARTEAMGGKNEMRNPEIMKAVLLDMMRESGARLLLYSLAVDAIVSDHVIRGIVVEGKSGPQAILGRIVIDCTGDGDVAAWAGAPFEIGRGRDEETQTQTLVFLLGNVNVPKLLAVREQIPEFVKQARANGDFGARFAAGAAISPVILGEHGVVNVNSINIPEVSGLRTEDLTYSQVQAMQDALALAAFYRKYVPGCEECYLLGTAEYMGVRESRRIVGEYVLSGEEVLSGATFRDGIARGFYPIDIHSADATGDASGAHPAVPYEIPYRCLVPKNIENLLVAGRCISTDHVAHGSVREMGTTMPLGEAAGCAAALCIAKGRTPRKLPGDQVRRALRDIGAWPTLRNSKVADNLALAANGTTASADSVFKSFAPDMAIDGYVSRGQESRWLSADTDLPHWLELDFPKPQTVREVTLYFYDPDGSKVYVPRGFRLEVGNGDGWQTVAQTTGNTAAEVTLKFPPTTTRRLRVVFTEPGPADKMIRLYEIVVH